MAASFANPRNSCSEKQISPVGLKHLIRKEGKYHKAQVEGSAGQLVTGRTEYRQFSEMSLDYKDTMQCSGSLFCCMVLGVLWKNWKKTAKLRQCICIFEGCPFISCISSKINILHCCFLCSAVYVCACICVDIYTFYIYIYRFKNNFQKWKIVLKFFTYKFPSFEDLMGNFHSWQIPGWRSSFFSYLT